MAIVEHEVEDGEELVVVEHLVIEQFGVELGYLDTLLPVFEVVGL